MSTAQTRRKMTPEEYLEFERTADVRHEFYRGQVFAMSGGSATHSRLKVRLIGILDRQAQAGGCQVYDSDMRIKIEGTGLYTYADASVTCSQPEFENRRQETLLNPQAVFEVLSQSTEAYDRGDKFSHYREISSLKHYVLISQWERLVEVFSRTDAGWAFDFRRDNDVVRLDAIQCEFRLDQLYDGIELSRDHGRPSAQDRDRDVPQE